MEDILQNLSPITVTINHFEQQSAKPSKKSMETDEILDFKGLWSTHSTINPICVETSGRNAKKEIKVYFGTSSFHHFNYNCASPGLKAYPFVDEFIFHTFVTKQNIVLELPILKKLSHRECLSKESQGR